MLGEPFHAEKLHPGCDILLGAGRGLPMVGRLRQQDGYVSRIVAAGQIEFGQTGRRAANRLEPFRGKFISNGLAACQAGDDCRGPVCPHSPWKRGRQRRFPGRERLDQGGPKCTGIGRHNFGQEISGEGVVPTGNQSVCASQCHRSEFNGGKRQGFEHRRSVGCARERQRISQCTARRDGSGQRVSRRTEQRINYGAQQQAREPPAREPQAGILSEESP